MLATPDHGDFRPALGRDPWRAPHPLPIVLCLQTAHFLSGWGVDSRGRRNSILSLQTPGPGWGTPQRRPRSSERPLLGKKGISVSRSESASGFALPFPGTIPTFTVKELHTHTHTHTHTHRHTHMYFWKKGKNSKRTSARLKMK